VLPSRPCWDDAMPLARDVSTRSVASPVTIRFMSASQSQ
jgi:hypothetical protein